MSELILILVSFGVFLASSHLVMRSLETPVFTTDHNQFSRRAMRIHKIYLRLAGIFLAVISLTFFMHTIWLTLNGDWGKF